MKRQVFRHLLLVAVVGSMAFAGGCRSSKPQGWDPNGVAGGDPFATDIPQYGSNLGLPMDGDRSLFPPVYFAYDSSQVNPAEAAKCEAVANHLRQGKGQGVIVEGHADERGSREYNLSLGERRALAVRDYLISLGVDYATIQTRTFGEEQPDDPGHDETAYSKNRRAVFAIY